MPIAHKIGARTESALVLCDRVLGEIGRRRHLFAWLRAPGAGTGEWLAVDAYYPAHRAVVLCRQGSAPSDDPYSETVPAHGLRLIVLDPALLGDDPDTARRALERLIAAIDVQPGAAAQPAGQLPQAPAAAPPAAAAPSPIATATTPSPAGSGRRDPDRRRDPRARARGARVRRGLPRDHERGPRLG